MLKTYIKTLSQHNHLTSKEAEKAVLEMLENGDESLIAGFLCLLSAKGETPDELFGMMSALQKTMTTIAVDKPLLDIVGTGGDNANTVNISTAASIVAASCGVQVAKHGNRAVSSQCGSANVLEALGIDIEMNAKQLIDCLQSVGMAFCFAPNFHPALKKLKTIREKLGIITAFNLLGPMLNPANISYALIGVYKENQMETFAQCLLKTSIKKAMVVHGNGLDELNLLGVNHVIEIKDNQKKSYLLDPRDYGFNFCRLSDIQGADANTNAKLLLEVFEGRENPIADTISLNAGVALYIADQATSIQRGIEMARESMQSGNTLDRLHRWINFSRGLFHE